MEQLKKAALRTAFRYLEKNPEENAPKLLAWVDRLAGDGPDSFPTQRAAFHQVLDHPENPMYQLLMRILRETDSGVLKAAFENFILNANLVGWPRQEAFRKQYDCNIPWAILLDPTSACNLRCTGCWAAEYGNRLNLTLEEMDSLIRQGKEGIEMKDKIAQLQEIIDQYDNIVFFGGAGVSTESGIPDFRSQDGLYHQKYDFPPETILSHTFFLNNTEEFFKFYRDKMLCDTAKPNAAHLKLAELEKAGKLKAVITQNIDNLHQMAGSRKVLELHGSVYRNYCMRCGKFYDFSYVKNSTGVPYCECGGVVKPDVVLYEEMLDSTTLAESVDAISRAQVLIIGGTSLAVYPAASLIDYFRGEAIVVINKAPTPRDRSADLLIKDPIGQVFSQIRTEGE